MASVASTLARAGPARKATEEYTRGKMTHDAKIQSRPSCPGYRLRAVPVFGYAASCGGRPLTQSWNSRSTRVSS
jgi:hypothetical protein